MTIGIRGPNEHLIGKPGSRHEIGTPALIIDLDILESNISWLAKHAQLHNYEVRPVAKIHKSVEIARLQANAGGRGPCCATLAESEVMVDGGLSDVMLFTSVVTNPKLERLSALNAKADGLIVVTDDPLNVDQLGASARASGKSLKVLVDIEVGGRRTGIEDEESAVEVAKLIAETDGLEYAGVQGYAGGHQGANDLESRRSILDQKLQPLIRVVERLHEENLPPSIISGGSTGTYDIDHDMGILTEVQAGTYVFMDLNYKGVSMQRDSSFPFQPSLSVLSTVISTSKPGLAVTDAGLKEIDNLNGLTAEILRGAPEGSTYRLCGDDMGRIEFANNSDFLRIGDVVELMPPHCYQTVNMYSHYHVVKGDKLVDIWPVDARLTW